MRFRPFLRATRGASIIGAILAALCLFGAAFAALSHFDLIAALRFSKAAKSENERIEGFFIEALSNQVMTVIEPATAATCATLRTRFPASLNISSGAGISISHVPAGSLPFSGYTGDEMHEAAKVRCRDNQKFSPSDNYTNQSAIYFCLELKPPTGSTEQLSVFKDGPVFAEVRLELQNLDSNTSISCSNFNASSGNTLRGALAYYSLYWQKAIKGKRGFYIKRGSTRLFSRL